MGQPDASSEVGRAEGFESVPLEVTIRVGSFRKKLQEVVTLQKGDVVKLNRRIGQSFDLLVERVHVAWVDPVACDERLKVKLVRVVEKKE